MKKLKEADCRSCCPVANTLDVLGDRWTLLVIRDLMLLNKHEFRDFVSGPEGIATNILSDRLQRLCCEGIINCRPHPKHKTKKLYYLTQKGKDLMPLMVELVLWGAAHRAVPGMPLSKVQEVKRNPKAFMKQKLRVIEAWESENLDS
jgi:DNA-binding HxlR family transcriptional regulator